MQYLGAEEYYFYEGLRIGHTLTLSGYEKTYDLDKHLKDMCPVTSVPMRDKCREAFTNGYCTSMVFSDKEYKALFEIVKPEKLTEAAPVKTEAQKESPSSVTWN